MDLRQAAITTRQDQPRHDPDEAARAAHAPRPACATSAPGPTSRPSSPPTPRVVAERISGAGPGGYAVDVLSARPRRAAHVRLHAAGGGDDAGDRLARRVDLERRRDRRRRRPRDQRRGRLAGLRRQRRRQARPVRPHDGHRRAPSRSGASTLSDEVIRAGQNATYTIDGGAEQESQTNVVTNAIAGLRLTFKGVTAPPASVTVGAPGLDTEARLRVALKAGRLGSWVLDLATEELTSTERCKAIFGRMAGQSLTYQELKESVHADDRAPMQERVAGAIASGHDFEAEYRTVWPNGSLHWAEARARIVKDEAGRPTKLIGALRGHHGSQAGRGDTGCSRGGADG